jgi:hypothetical protein
MLEVERRTRRRLVGGRVSTKVWRPLVRGLKGSFWGRRSGRGHGNAFGRGARVYGSVNEYQVEEKQMLNEKETYARMKFIAIVERSLRTA